MDITQINTTDKVGGAAKVAYRLYEYLCKGGFNSFMYVGLKTSEEVNIRSLNPVYNLLMHIPVLRRYVRKSIDFGKLSRRNWKKLLMDDSIIHIHNIHGEYFDIDNLSYLKNSNKKIVWTLHDMWLITANEAHTNDGYWQTKNFSTLDEKRKEILKRRRKILNDLDITYVLPSNWLKENFEKSFLCKKPHVVINNGVDTKSFFKEEKFSARKELRLPQDKKIVLFVAQGGRDNIWKGGDIWNYIVKNLSIGSKDILFIEVGRTKSDIWEKDNYLSVGYTDDASKLRRYYNSADVLCFPSKAENYSLVLLEALACGLPVVCFNVGGNPEIIKNSENGYVVNNIDKKNFSAKVVKILNNEKMLKMISKNNIEKSQKLSFENMVKNYIKLYKSL